MASRFGLLLGCLLSVAGGAVAVVPSFHAKEPSSIEKKVSLFHGCLDNVSRALPYCDPRLSTAARVDDVLARINVTETIGLLSPHDPPHYCGCLTAPVPRIGLPSWRVALAA